MLCGHPPWRRRLCTGGGSAGVVLVLVVVVVAVAAVVIVVVVVVVMAAAAVAVALVPAGTVLVLGRGELQPHHSQHHHRSSHQPQTMVKQDPNTQLVLCQTRTPQPSPAPVLQSALVAPHRRLLRTRGPALASSTNPAPSLSQAMTGMHNQGSLRPSSSSPAEQRISPPPPSRAATSAAAPPSPTRPSAGRGGKGGGDPHATSLQQSQIGAPSSARPN